VSKIETGTKYFDDADKIQSKLEDVHKRVMLEEQIPDTTSIIRCFINGGYYFKRNYIFNVSTLKAFIGLLRSCSKEKRNIIFSNIHSKLDAVTRYTEKVEFDDDIPF
jgi:eukaryotic-like serine/threonine-protein kinase